MSEESERDLLQSLKENLRLAAEDCESIATHPFRGFIYDRMRKRLKIVESTCTRIGVHRNGDARWLPIGLMMEEAHQRCGNWLRKTQAEESRRRAIPMFRKLAANLRGLLAQAEALETRKTGTMGMILPKPLPLHREGRPVQVPRGYKSTDSGLIVPV